MTLDNNTTFCIVAITLLAMVFVLAMLCIVLSSVNDAYTKHSNSMFDTYRNDASRTHDALSRIERSINQVSAVLATNNDQDDTNE